jgi:3-phosphoshikimate 1-carboxyvinyltransferase
VLRFLLPLAALHCPGPVRFVGSDALFGRPLAPLLTALEKIGAAWQWESGGGLLVPPKRRPGRVELEIDGGLSSQFVSGAAIAIGGLPNGGAIKILNESQDASCEMRDGECGAKMGGGQAAPSGRVSGGYLSLTSHWLGRFGCRAALREGFFEIPGGGLKAAAAQMPGDWGAAAPFFCAAAVLGGEVVVGPLDESDGQPDAAILPILKKVGCAWRFDGGRCRFKGRLDGGIEADLIACPDLAPVLAAAAAFAPGPSELRGLGALPHKECDRLACIIDLVAWLGGRAEPLSQAALRIAPRPFSAPGPSAPFDPKGDHRMAFAAAIGGMRLGGSLLGPECAAKSFPRFFEQLR